MKNVLHSKAPSATSMDVPTCPQPKGFSLLELMVAMAIFLIIGGAAVALVRRHVPLFNSAQNQAGLNVALRNAVAQMQMEVVNAGSGYSATNPMPFWPVGATITPAATPNCQATAIYVSTCFDTLTLITADSVLPPLAPSSNQLGTIAVDTNGGTDLYLTSPGNPALVPPATYATWAARFQPGDEIMLIQGGTEFPNGQPSMTVLVVQAPGGAAAGNSVHVSFASTGNLAACPINGVATAVKGIPQAKDPLGIYDPTAAANPPECSRFFNSFNPGLDYAIRLTSTKYYVDTTVAANPKLVRLVTGAAGPDVVAEQIIGFQVGAWSSNTSAYNMDPSAYGRDWASIRSLLVRIVARAAPSNDNQGTGNFKNSYDQGPYQVQGMSVVINPRNMSSN
jgi:prepilin-type N-terminal cleavage/methylation domain-containing protein